MITYLWVDTETTGVDTNKHEIIQIAGIVEIPGICGQEFNFFCQPSDWSSIDPKALEINRTTIKDLEGYPSPAQAHADFKKFLFKYVNPFDPSTRLVPSGQNVKFDIDMLNEFCKRHLDNYWFSCVTAGFLDLRTLSVQLEMFRNERLFTSYKLNSICDFLGVRLDDAHDAMADILATRECCIKIWNEISKEDI